MRRVGTTTTTFALRIYPPSLRAAGTVTYTAHGLLSDNRDTLFDDLTGLMAKAKGAPLLQALFAEKRRAVDEAGKAKRPPTSSQQFRASVTQLIEVLQECAPHYVRCIKPNGSKAALAVDDELFANQVSEGGGGRPVGGGLQTQHASHPHLHPRSRFPHARAGGVPGHRGGHARQARGLCVPCVVRGGAGALPHAVQGHVAAARRHGRQDGERIVGLRNDAHWVHAAASLLATLPQVLTHSPCHLLTQAVTELLKAIAVIPKPAEQGALGVGMAAPGGSAGRGGPVIARGRGRGRGGAARGGGVVGGAGRGKRPVATATIAPKPGATVPAAATAPAAPVAPVASPAVVAGAGVKGTGGSLPGDIGGPGTYPLRDGVDYQLGVSKLFIKEPRNLFALEVRRAGGDRARGTGSDAVRRCTWGDHHAPPLPRAPQPSSPPAVHALAGAWQGGFAHRGAVARARGQAPVCAHPRRVGAHAGARAGRGMVC
jgi:hypothetical protein